MEGQIQMAWEYTGTAWISYLGHDTASRTSSSSTRR